VADLGKPSTRLISPKWFPGRRVASTASIPPKSVADFVTLAIPGEKKGMNLGVIHYITKPWGPGVVEAAVRVALGAAQEASADQGGEENEDSELWSYPVEYQDEPDEMEDDEHIRTAGRLTPLEKILGGGLSFGTLTLIEGATTAGKSIVCQLLSYGALTSGHKIAYLTSEHSTYSFVEQMKSIGLDVSRYVSDDRIGIYPMQEPVQGIDSGPVLAAMALDMEQSHEKCDFITIDAITNLAGFTQEQAILAFFSSLRRQCSLGKTIVVVAHYHALSEDIFSRLGSLCDNHFKLRAGKMRSKMVRMLEVAKANGMELDRDNLVVFEVVKGVGARVIPMSQIKA